MKAKELLVSAGSLLLAGLILVVAGNAVAPAAAANAAAEQMESSRPTLATSSAPSRFFSPRRRESRAFIPTPVPVAKAIIRF